MTTSQPDVPETPSGSPLLSNRQFDILTRFVQIILPGIGAFYFSIAQILELPGGEQVVAIAAALSLFGGVILRASARSYESTGAKYDGEVLVTGNPEQPHSLVFNVPLAEMEAQKQITLKVIGGS